MRCGGTEANGDKVELDFCLTICFRKIDGRWTVMQNLTNYSLQPIAYGAAELKRYATYQKIVTYIRLVGVERKHNR